MAKASRSRHEPVGAPGREPWGTGPAGSRFRIQMSDEGVAPRQQACARCECELKMKGENKVYLFIYLF